MDLSPVFHFAAEFIVVAATFFLCIGVLSVAASRFMVCAPLEHMFPAWRGYFPADWRQTVDDDMGIIVDSPQPLRNCPTLPVWRKKSGETYLFFIDETYSQFFELNSRGYFCHGGVGVPEGDYKQIKKELTPVFEKYRRLLVPELKELKHKEFKRIAFAERWDLARRIHEVLYSHSCFVSAFYTPAQSFLFERVRLHLLGDANAIPADSKRLVAEASQKTKDDWEGPGMSDVIGMLIRSDVSGLLHFAAALDLTIKVVYDPRERKEDAAVKKAILSVSEDVAKLTPPTAGRLLDVNVTSTSEDEIGIQLADLVAGEARVFFEANREMLEHGASPKLITPDSDEPVQAYGVFFDKPFKTGAVTSMPNALQARFFKKDPKERSVLSCLADLFLSGTITCYSSWGAPRHVMIYDKVFFDQLD